MRASRFITVMLSIKPVHILFLNILFLSVSYAGAKTSLDGSKIVSALKENEDKIVDLKKENVK